MTRIVPFFAAALFALAGSAQAEHARPSATADLAETARQVAYTTRGLTERIAVRADRGERRARTLLPALRKLERRAERFAAAAARNRVELDRLERRHARLDESVRFAADCAAELGMRHVRRDLERIDRRVDRLDRQIARVRVARYEARERLHAWRDRDATEHRYRRHIAWRWPWIASRWADGWR